MSTHSWDAQDYESLWTLAEREGDTIRSEADLYRHVSEALALVKDEPPYVPQYGPSSLPAWALSRHVHEEAVQRVLDDDEPANEWEEPLTFRERVSSWALGWAVVAAVAVAGTAVLTVAVGGVLAAVRWIGGVL